MALSLSSYANPYSTSPTTTAYVSIQLISADFTVGQGMVQVGVYFDRPSFEASLPAIDSFSVGLGVTLVPGDPTATPPSPAVTFPTLEEIIVNAATYSTANPSVDPFNCVKAVLYDALLLHPKLAGATEITD